MYCSLDYSSVIIHSMTKTFIYIMFLHFLADFILQPREMGQKKSSEFKWLAGHIAIQISVMAIGLMLLLEPWTSIKFAVLNGLIHAVIDWNIWKGYKLTAYYRLRKVKAEDVECDSPAQWDMVQAMDNKQLVEFLGKRWKYWEDHLFYTTIGLDQFLHITTLVILWWWV
jgi:hypothetical protein